MKPVMNLTRARAARLSARCCPVIIADPPGTGAPGRRDHFPDPKRLIAFIWHYTKCGYY